MDIKTYREMNGYSQHAFGQLFDPPIPQSLVHQWETGERKVPLHQAIRIEDGTKKKVTIREMAAVYKPAPKSSASGE